MLISGGGAFQLTPAVMCLAAFGPLRRCLSADALNWILTYTTTVPVLFCSNCFRVLLCVTGDIHPSRRRSV